MANEIRKIKDAAESQLKKTDEIIASHEAVADMISEVNNALSEVNNTLASGFTMLGAGLQELCFITEDGFREVIDRLDLQNKTLDAIKEILERPLDTQAKELRKRAETAYLNNWINEAEIDLLEAENKNYQDFIVHQILGNIYYHHKKNYPKSLEYYQKAAKYATPVSKKHAANALICAAITYYQLGQLSEAYKVSKTALELSLDDPHVLYNHARYSAKMGYEFTTFLKCCVYADPNYLVTADGDDIFSDVKEKITKLAEELRDEKRKAVNTLIQAINTAKKEAESVGINDFTSLDKQLVEINKLCARNSYFDFLKAEQIARKAYKESVEEWIEMKNSSIGVENTSIGKMKSEENEVKNKSYAGMGFFPAFLTFMLAFKMLPAEKNSSDFIGNLIIAPLVFVFYIFWDILGYEEGMKSSSYGPSFFFLGWVVPIIIWVVSAIIIKRIKLNEVRNQIEKVENNITKLKNDITKLSSLKK